MRLLFVSNLFPPLMLGGYEQICYDVACGLRKRGHEVHVLTSSYCLDAAPEGEKSVYRRLKLKEHWGNRAGEKAPWIARNRIDLERHNALTVRRTIRGVRPDLVMIWGGTNMGRGFLSAAERYAQIVYYLSDPWFAPILAVNHQTGPIEYVRRVYYLALQLIGVPGNKVAGGLLLFCSHALATQYRRIGAQFDRYQVVYHGVSPQLFCLQPQHILLRAKGEPHRILYVGQLRKAKGVETLLEALPIVRALPDLARTRLRFVGPIPDPDYGVHLRRRAAELGLSDAVEFVSSQPRASLPGIYGDHDVLAFPSEWEEPFSVTLLEAMATGVPTVASLTGGSREIVRDGGNALAFQAGDARDLAEKLGRALRNPQESARMGREAAREVSTNFTLDHEVAAIERALLAATRTQM